MGGIRPSPRDIDNEVLLKHCVGQSTGLHPDVWQHHSLLSKVLKVGKTDRKGLLDNHYFRELRDIMDYANKFHHVTSPTYKGELRNMNGNELKSYVDRVLEVMKYRKAEGS